MKDHVPVITAETIFTNSIPRSVVSDAIESLKKAKSAATDLLVDLCEHYGLDTVREVMKLLNHYERDRGPLIDIMHAEDSEPFKATFRDDKQETKKYVETMGSFPPRFIEAMNYVFSGLDVNHLSRASLMIYKDEAQKPMPDYKVEVIYDLWDCQRPLNSSWNSPFNDHTHGTIVIDGVQRMWWLRYEQTLVGQVICIDLDDVEKDDWNLNWAWRSDYGAIKYAVIKALSDRHAPEFPETQKRLDEVTRYIHDAETVQESAS